MRTIKGGMLYQIDLDPAHSVIRLTVNEGILTHECVQDMYQRLSLVASEGGPYAVIYDLSIPRDISRPTDKFRSLVRRPPSIPMGRPHVVVGKFPVVYGLARLFQMCAEFRGQEFQIVRTLKEAYDIVGVLPEDFTKRIYPEPEKLVA